MRILVASDSHGDYLSLQRAIKREHQKEPLDAFIFLGDGERDYELATMNYGGITTYRVRGNNDWDSGIRLSMAMDIGAHKYLICHGHSFGIGRGYDSLINAANQNGCQVALFGHTHCQYYSYERGVHLFNPGSVALPRDGKGRSYGIITEEKGKLDFFHYSL